MVYRHVDELIKLVQENIENEKERHDREMARLQAILSDLIQQRPKRGQNGHGNKAIAGVNPKMKIVDAVLAYLTAAGGPVDVTAMVSDLRRAGVVLGKQPKRYEQNVRITLSNHRDKFAVKDASNTVELLS